jgi:alpha-N-arabinofuranosidase
MARIKLDPDRVIGSVDRRIFGGFIEHLGRCIYGGVFDEGSPLSDERGFRTDVLAAARDLRVPVLRWPGGNFVSGYHWADGVGPVEQRPRRMELAWHDVEPNRFGTDEFVAYCRALGAEPFICLNMGTGTLEEARQWLEYCNATRDTTLVAQRRANGHPDPHNVPYWGLGNEMYGEWQLGYMTASEYVKTARQWAKTLRRVDPDIKLVSCGQNGWSDWDAEVVDGLAPYVDFHSIHIYTGSPDYWSNVLAPHQAERALRITRSLIDRARYTQKLSHSIHVAYDEWNVWYRQRDEDSGLEERYDLSDALAVATYLNVFVRQCQTVRMANLAQMVNVIAPIVTSPDGMFLQTIYHPLRLVAEHTQELSLDAHVDSDTVTHGDPVPPIPRPWPHRVGDLGPFKLLDVAATRDPDGTRCALMVVNRDPDAAVTARIDLGGMTAGQVTSHLVHGPNPQAMNSFDAPEEVTVLTKQAAGNGSELEHEFPPHSFTVLQLDLT